MLVTQRITKYPILVERIIQNTEGKYQYTWQTSQAFCGSLLVVRDVQLPRLLCVGEEAV